MFNLITDKKKNIRRTAMAVICTLVLAPVLTFCVPSTDQVMKGVINIIFEVAKYVGIVLAVSGIFQLILAYKDDNADGQSRAVRLVVVALVLLGLKTLVKMTGLI
ncbi:MAG: hypothetical protein ACI4KE_03770 [Anaerovoracaceae bacterium]